MDILSPAIVAVIGRLSCRMAAYLNGLLQAQKELLGFCVFPAEDFLDHHSIITLYNMVQAVPFWLSWAINDYGLCRPDILLGFWPIGNVLHFFKLN